LSSASLLTRFGAWFSGGGGFMKYSSHARSMFQAYFVRYSMARFSLVVWAKRQSAQQWNQMHKRQEVSSEERNEQKIQV
jgi:hypothetical protein